MTTVNIRIEELAQQLDLEILERGKGIICFRSSEISRPGLQFAGFYDHFHPHRVQLIGNAEMNYLYSQPHKRAQGAYEPVYGAGDSLRGMRQGQYAP